MFAGSSVPPKPSGRAGVLAAPRRGATPKGPTRPRAWLGAATGQKVTPADARVRIDTNQPAPPFQGATPRRHHYRGVARAAGLLMLIGSGGKPNRARDLGTTDRWSAF